MEEGKISDARLMEVVGSFKEKMHSLGIKLDGGPLPPIEDYEIECVKDDLSRFNGEQTTRVCKWLEVEFGAMDARIDALFLGPVINSRNFIVFVSSVRRSVGDNPVGRPPKYSGLKKRAFEWSSWTVPESHADLLMTLSRGRGVPSAQELARYEHDELSARQEELDLEIRLAKRKLGFLQDEQRFLREEMVVSVAMLLVPRTAPSSPVLEATEVSSLDGTSPVSTRKRRRDEAEIERLRACSHVSDIESD